MTIISTDGTFFLPENFLVLEKGEATRLLFCPHPLGDSNPKVISFTAIAFLGMGFHKSQGFQRHKFVNILDFVVQGSGCLTRAIPS